MYVEAQLCTCLLYMYLPVVAEQVFDTVKQFVDYVELGDDMVNLLMCKLDVIYAAEAADLAVVGHADVTRILGVQAFEIARFLD